MVYRDSTFRLRIVHSPISYILYDRMRATPRASTPHLHTRRSRLDPGHISGEDAHTLGDVAVLEEAERVLRKRGRWRNDIAFIYARTSLDSSHEASARLK